MEQVQPGMELDPQTLIQVQQNFIASARIKEVQLEAAVQQLSIQNPQLMQQIEQITAEAAPEIQAKQQEG